HNQTPNSPVPDEVRQGMCITVPYAPCIGTSTSWNPKRITFTARSHHPGGVNLLLGDGSVRFVSNDINLSTWRALSSPKGGEALGDSYSRKVRRLSRPKVCLGKAAFLPSPWPPALPP